MRRRERCAVLLGLAYYVDRARVQILARGGLLSELQRDGYLARPEATRGDQR